MKKRQQIVCIAGAFTCFLAGCKSDPGGDTRANVRNAVIASMDCTVTNWSPVDAAMRDAVSYGDAAVPDLEAIAWGNHLNSSDIAHSPEKTEGIDGLVQGLPPKAWQRARAIALLQRIGTKAAKDCLVKLAMSNAITGELHFQAICALGLLAGEDVAATGYLIDRSWYERKQTHEWFDAWLLRVSACGPTP